MTVEDLFPLSSRESVAVSGGVGGVSAVISGGRSVSLTQTANESLLLNNLQKLEESGKVVSPRQQEVSARDIVTGIISAANRKMQRGGGGGSSSSVATARGKRESVMDAAELAGARYTHFCAS